MGWPLALLGGWLLRSKPGPARSESARSEEMVVYTQAEVHASLAMVAQSLQAKNGVILELSDQLEAALTRVPTAAAANGQCASLGTADADSSGSAQLLADLRAATARCQEQQQQIVELRQQLQPAAAAQTELTAAQAELAAARQQRETVKRQLATVKLELADARQAQGRAAGALEHVDAAIVQLRQEKDELQSMLTQRESAYLTLLETVQELFRQHSPSARSASASGDHSPAVAEDEEEAEAVGRRLQTKLKEWQQRLESAAKLRPSADRGQAASSAAAAELGGSSTGSAAAEASSPGRSTSGAGGYSLGASQVRAAIEAAAAADEGPASSSSGSISPLASPRIPAARPAATGGAAAAVSANGTPARGSGTLARRGTTPARGGSTPGSRIKQLGLQAAGSPAVSSSAVRSPAVQRKPPTGLQGQQPLGGSSSSSPATTGSGGSGDLSSQFCSELSERLDIHSPTRGGGQAGRSGRQPQRQQSMRSLQP